MAVNTPLKFRNLNIYNLFVRNFTEAGTFNAIHSELDRIKYLGTDIICFMPFYPIGEEKRKGSLGSPYAIKDHRAIDPIIGTLTEFELLVKEIHKRNMKVMIDIVFNHTSPDSVLANEHPEWFFRNEDGSLGNQIGDWYDIVDLDYRHLDLWNYQIDTLKYWAKLVDGFRCDAAPLIPLDFWIQARKQIDKINPTLIWLADSIEKQQLVELRSYHITAHSDSELYQAFDMSYQYDVYKEFDDYLRGQIPLSHYVHALNTQDAYYPSNYVKVHLLENFNQERIIHSLFDIDSLIQWTAFNFLQKGATLVYNGQEVGSNQRLSLFDKDSISWQTGIDLSGYFGHLAQIKREYVPFVNVPYELVAFDEIDTIVLYYKDTVQKRIGIFNLKHCEGSVQIDVPDGEYTNLINNNNFVVYQGKMDLTDTPVFFVYS